MKERLVFHVCCAPCAAYPISTLRDEYEIILFFCGYNIHPKAEYVKRFESAKELARALGICIVESEYDPSRWYNEVKGFEDDLEGGERCKVCYRMRIEDTANYAKDNGYMNFGTTLTLSPHKPASIINPIGESIAKKYCLNFLSEDFKKQDGFKKSCEMSKDLGLYRQKYCGCEYSMRPSR